MSDHDKDAAASGAAAFMKLAKHFGFGFKDPSEAGFVSAVVSKEEMADRVMAKIKETARKKPVMPFISADDGGESLGDCGYERYERYERNAYR